MTSSNKTTIKSYFTTGSKPSQSNFVDLIDSYVDTSAGVLYTPTITSATIVSPTITGAIVSAVLLNPTITSAAIAGSTLTTANIVGTITGNNAVAGSVGEMIESTEVSAKNLTSGQTTNVTSIALTPGDWDVWGSVSFAANGATTANQYVAAVNTISSALPSTFNYNITSGTFGAGLTAQQIPTGVMRINVSATTTTYLTTQATFAVSTMTVAGYIGARRRR